MMALPAPHYLGLRAEGLDEAAASPGSEVSDAVPRRLRYSEELIPLHYYDEIDANASATSSKADRRLKVYVRIKPSSVADAGVSRQAAVTGAGCAASTGNGSFLQATSTDVALRMRDGGTTTFSVDQVFEGSEQHPFFDAAIKPLLEDLVFLRTGCSVFMAYGASGTGKSYTMCGTVERPGVIPLTLEQLFRALADLQLEHQVQVSYYEVYGNKVTDLLRPLERGASAGAAAGGAGRAGAGVKPHQPPQQGHHPQQQPALPIVRMGSSFCLPGLLRCHILSAEEGLRLYTAAAKLRKKEATKVNSESSRSHAVFTVQLLEVENGIAKGRSATLSLVDLAGAERAAQTHHVGNKLRESAGINSSLSVLRRCLEALRHNQTLAQRAAAGGPGAAVAAAAQRMLPPVRESGLTTLFSSVLSGKGNLALSVHLSTASSDYALTLETLKFSALASRLTVNAAAPEAAAVAAPPPRPSQQARSGGPSGACHNARRCANVQEPIPEAIAEEMDEGDEMKEEEELLVKEGEEEEEEGEGAMEVEGGEELAAQEAAGAEHAAVGTEVNADTQLAGLRDKLRELETARETHSAGGEAVETAGGWARLLDRATGSLRAALDLAADLERQLEASRREVQEERAARQALEQQLQAGQACRDDRAQPQHHQQALEDALAQGQQQECEPKPSGSMRVEVEQAGAGHAGATTLRASDAAAAAAGACAPAAPCADSVAGLAGDALGLVAVARCGEAGVSAQGEGSDNGGRIILQVERTQHELRAAASGELAAVCDCHQPGSVNGVDPGGNPRTAALGDAGPRSCHATGSSGQGHSAAAAAWVGPPLPEAQPGTSQQQQQSGREAVGGATGSTRQAGRQRTAGSKSGKRRRGGGRSGGSEADGDGGGDDKGGGAVQPGESRLAAAGSSGGAAGADARSGGEDCQDGPSGKPGRGATPVAGRTRRKRQAVAPWGLAAPRGQS